MDFLLNDLSFHEQFPNIDSFKESLRKIMQIREIVCRSGRNVYCQKSIFNVNVLPSIPIPRAVQELNENERRSLLAWLQKGGPFWDEERKHQPDDWLEHNADIVTDTAVGEAAWCNLNGIPRGLVSLEPSNWNFSPVKVDWVSDKNIRSRVDVANYWDAESIKTFLDTLPVPISSWASLQDLSKAKYTNLTFADDAFLPLNGIPFSSSASDRIFSILNILNRYKTCFDAAGVRTQEGHEIYQDFFTGQKGEGGRGPVFSDSSETEKNDFKKELTFKHPLDSNKTIFCPWHGKIQTPQLRVHFSMPITAGELLFIVYVGEKKTKQ